MTLFCKFTSGCIKLTFWKEEHIIYRRIYFHTAGLHNQTECIYPLDSFWKCVCSCSTASFTLAPALEMSNNACKTTKWPEHNREFRTTDKLLVIFLSSLIRVVHWVQRCSTPRVHQSRAAHDHLHATRPSGPSPYTKG